MENAQRCRAIALLCRQQASIHPQDNWKWLAQAERWEHLAEARMILKAEAPTPVTSVEQGIAAA